MLVTVGLSFAAVALFEGIWGTDPINIAGPPWLKQTTEVLGARIPNTYWVLMIAAVLVLAALVLFLQKTRYGMVIRAGVENRSMVTALGIDVRRSFTLVFAIGGAAAGIGGVLAMHYYDLRVGAPRLDTPDLRVHRHRDRRARLADRRGDRLGARGGAAAVRELYLGGTGDFIVVILLAVVLLVRPVRHPGEEGMIRSGPARSVGTSPHPRDSSAPR